MITTVWNAFREVSEICIILCLGALMEIGRVSLFLLSRAVQMLPQKLLDRLYLASSRLQSLFAYRFYDKSSNTTSPQAELIAMAASSCGLHVEIHKV